MRVSAARDRRTDDAGPTRVASTRVAVIGDIAGHVDQLRAELRRLGADARTQTLPADLLVVQVGDLVHRGPDSAGVVALVERYLNEQPDQWVQLVGNHEAQYLSEPKFRWPERLDPATADTLRRWWSSGQMVAAVALRTPHEDLLITHAGLTVGFWREVLDRLTIVDRVADAVNSLIGTHEDVLFSAGQMLGGGRPAPLAGPLWAATATELLPPWVRTHLPFSQIHGHSSLVDWSDRKPQLLGPLGAATALDVTAKHETTVLPGGRIIGVDPGHGVRPRRPWRAWESPLAP